MSRDPEHEYLSDGIVGGLIDALATVPKLRVMAQGTAIRYKSRGIDSQAAGRELNVRAVRPSRVDFFLTLPQQRQRESQDGLDMSQPCELGSRLTNLHG